MTQWRLMIAASLACAMLAFAGPKDEEAVKKRVQEFQDAFNKHDAKALSAFWTKDGDLINPAGMTATGPAEIEKLIQSDLDNIIRGATSTFTVNKLHFIKPDVCVANMTHEFSGGKAPDGSMLPPGKALVTGIAVKQSNTWMWEAGRPMIPFTPPGPPPTQAAAPKMPAAPAKAPK
jgi:uncharacterized protein (TIGR02246 family)